MGREMKTCACCGQVIPPPDRLTVRVDDDLLQLCNQAYGEAGRRGGQRVEIGHVVWCLTSSAGSGRWFESVGLLRLALADAVARWLAADDRAGAPAERQASHDLKTLLTRAEQFADGEGRGFAGPTDFLRVLAEQSGDLRSAAFAREASRSGDRSPVPGWPGVSPPLADNRGLDRQAAATRANPRKPYRSDLHGRDHQPKLPFDEAAREGLYAPSRKDDTARRGAVAGHATATSNATANAVQECLERQEHDIAELRSLTARLLERHRDDASSGRIDRSNGPRDASGERSRNASRNLRSRLRLRAGGWSMRARDDDAGSSQPRRLPPVIRPQRVEVDDVQRPNRAVRPLASDPAAAMYAQPDNDSGDDAEGSGDRLKRFYLSPDDDIVKAPSIGPRTAARLSPAGLMLVRDLLSCDPTEVAARVGARYMTADRIADWKAQARLVCTIPWLRGTHAQLLVGAGYDTIGKLVRADASIVCAAILRFAATREGQGILRSGPAPEIDRIACWIENTALAEPARAA